MKPLIPGKPVGDLLFQFAVSASRADLPQWRMTLIECVDRPIKIKCPPLRPCRVLPPLRMVSSVVIHYFHAQEREYVHAQDTVRRARMQTLHRGIDTSGAQRNKQGQ